MKKIEREERNQCIPVPQGHRSNPRRRFYFQVVDTKTGESEDISSIYREGNQPQKVSAKIANLLHREYEEEYLTKGEFSLMENQMPLKKF